MGNMLDHGPTFWSRTPAPGLKGLVSGVFGYDEHGQAMARLVEPAGLDVPLIINFGTAFEIGLARAPGRADTYGSFAAGLFAGPVVMNSDGRAQCIQVNFTPIGGRMFYRMPLSELAERMVELDALADTEINELAARLAELNSWPARLDLAERFIVNRLGRAEPVDSQVAWACRQIEARHGNLRIGALCDELGWSRRRMVEQFRGAFGMAPKAVARIARFATAEAMAMGTPRPDWADIAAACGYSDQAHLTREFVELAGRTPTAFRAAA